MIFKYLKEKNELSFLLWTAAATALAFTGWRVLLNNFAVDFIGMNGQTIGIQQSLREVPGLLAFTILFWLLFIKEQSLMLISISLMGLGVALTGFLPTVYGFYFTTVVMSFGFHYAQVLNSSLAYQFFEKKSFNALNGKVRSSSAFFAIISFIIIIVMFNFFHLSYKVVYIVSGILAFLIACYLFTFPKFSNGREKQKKKIIIKKEYSLFYWLQFLSGARRQIFVVFASLLLVAKFNFSVTHMAILFMITQLMTMFIAPYIGKVIDVCGEKKALHIEYFLLVIIFIAYAYNSSGKIASLLYVLDNLVFALSLALNGYFKKIASYEDLTSSSSVTFTINHIAAVFLPFALGYVWMSSIKEVFLIAASIAFVSLLSSFLIKTNKEESTLQSAIKY